MDRSQEDPVNVLEQTDSLAKPHDQDSQEQIVLKEYTFAYVPKNGRLPKATKNNCFFIFQSACAMKLNWSAQSHFLLGVTGLVCSHGIQRV